MNYLVVWDDARAGPADIYGARVTPQGEVLDPGGFPISIASSVQGSPEVAFNGTNYLVVWTDNRNGTPDAYGARVSPDGTVLDASGIPITDGTISREYPGGIAFDAVPRDKFSIGTESCSPSTASPSAYRPWPSTE